MRPGAVCAGSGRLEKLRIKEAMTRGALPHGGGGRRFAFGGRFECSCVAAFAPRRGRRVAAPTARGMGAGLLRFRCAQAFRVGHKKRGSSHAAAHTAGPRSPHQPSGGSEGSRALRAVFRIPGSFSKSSIWRRNPARARDRLHASSGRPASLTCAADSAALRQQGYLTPSAACAGRERVPSGHLGRRPKATCRREQIQGLRAASAQNADICEVPAAKPPAE